MFTDELSLIHLLYVCIKANHSGQECKLNNYTINSHMRVRWVRELREYRERNRDNRAEREEGKDMLREKGVKVYSCFLRDLWRNIYHPIHTHSHTKIKIQIHVYI